jgi:hypothetical protein
MPQVIYKPHCHYQNFSPLANGLYLIATTNKTPLRSGNCPITDPITKMGVARTVGQDLKKVKFENIYLVNMGQLAIYNHKMFIRLLNFIEFCISKL